MMPLPVSSALAAASWRLLYKLADHYRFLPSSVYFRKSLSFLKNGNLSEAEKYNSIALDKSADYEKALVLKDIIALRRDTALSKLANELLMIQERRAEAMCRRRKFMRNQNFYKLIPPFLSLCAIGALFSLLALLLAFILQSFIFIATVYLILPSAMLLISIVFLLIVKVNEQFFDMKLKESEAVIEACNKELHLVDVEKNRILDSQIKLESVRI